MNQSLTHILAQSTFLNLTKLAEHHPQIAPIERAHNLHKLPFQCGIEAITALESSKSEVIVDSAQVKWRHLIPKQLHQVLVFKGTYHLLINQLTLIVANEDLVKLSKAEVCQFLDD